MERTIPDPGFADDEGLADPGLAAALVAHADGTGTGAAVLGALQDARLLVPVVAVLGEVEVDEHGLAHDKTSDMAAVLLQHADGRKGLLAFTSLETMRRWDPQARPVPVRAATAATAALQDGAQALLVDVAGPASYVLGGDALRRVAEGWRVAVVGGDPAWIGPARD